MEEIRAQVMAITQKAKTASRELVVVSARLKNRALISMAAALVKNTPALLKANEQDIEQAKAAGLGLVLVDRLLLNKQRIAQMSASLKIIAGLADPLGRVLRTIRRPNGLLIKKVSVPIGVVAIIYESRPNVTSDCIGLCLKSGNAVILRGGKESINSNLAIFDVLQDSLVKHKLPEGAINLIGITDRKAVDILLGAKDYVDLVIPRGGESLINLVSRKSKIPVIKHYKGICHTYVDSEADLTIARQVVFNAKVQRPGVCNAMETLLVHQAAAKRFLPAAIADLRNAGVEIRGDAAVCAIVKDIKRAREKDWATEYLDLILSVKVVRNLDEAIAHINCYGSGHSDAIITRNRAKAARFMNKVDSACVYLNASTRFTDGYEFGMGAEMGISTDKLHARGPMALEELTTYKYEIFGSGQIRV